MEKFLNFLICSFYYFAKNGSVHGISFIGNKRISNLERCLWLIVVLVALGSSLDFLKTNLDRYLANPTVVTIEREFRHWNNQFPAATACYINKVDKDKAKDYIFSQWNTTPNDDKFEYYQDFIDTVSNLTYDSLSSLKKFQNDENLKNTDWLDLIIYVHPSLEGTLATSQAKIKSDWQFVITELGVCFTLNAKFANLLSPTKVRAPPWNQTMKCHYLSGVCYARYDSDPRKILKYYVHSPLELLHATSEAPIILKKGVEYEVNYMLAQTYSMDDIRYLTPNQRNCRFDDEPITNNVPIYSTSVCYMECRYRLAMDRCGCRPFFYNFLDGKLCDISGLLCLAKIWYFFNQTSTNFLGCDCPQQCNLMVYLKQVPKITNWNRFYLDERISFRWGLIPPTTKYHRKILFGFQELIVSFGGALSLFLGYSFISTMEAVFLFIEYSFNYFGKNM